MANYYLESIVVNELLKRDIGHIHIVSSLNTSFLEANISSSERFTYHERVLDTGGYQSTPLDVDMLKTLENYYEKIHCHREAILIAEVKFLKEMKVDAVLVDSVPLACLAGKLAGARVTLVSNFSWDFIFQGMLESLPAATPRYSEYAEMVVQCSIDYQSVDHYLQLPGNTPTLSSSILANKIIPCPLVSRTAKQSAGKVRQELISRVSVKRESMTCNDTKESISADCPAESVAAESASSSNILLLSFGGHSTTSFHLCDEMLPAGWVCCTLGFKESELPQDSHRFVALPLDSYVPDLVNAADVVIGKIGEWTFEWHMDFTMYLFWLINFCVDQDTGQSLSACRLFRQHHSFSSPELGGQKNPT